MPIQSNDFLAKLAECVGDQKLSDAEFRAYVADILPEVKFTKPKKTYTVYSADIQFGLFGYVLAEEKFEGRSIEALTANIFKRVKELIDELIEAEETDGDLRRYTPQMANGYFSFGSIEPEFGGDDFYGCVLDLKGDGQEIAYNAKVHKQLRSSMGLH